jgi:hypothetical protein
VRGSVSLQQCESSDRDRAAIGEGLARSWGQGKARESEGLNCFRFAGCIEGDHVSTGRDYEELGDLRHGSDGDVRYPSAADARSRSQRNEVEVDCCIAGVLDSDTERVLGQCRRSDLEPSHVLDLVCDLSLVIVSVSVVWVVVH